MYASACNGSKDSSSIFYLVGIPSLQDVLYLPVFFTFLSFYLLILVGNALILMAMVIEPRLHKPMYFFLINLSALGILFTTVPKMLSLLLPGDHYTSASLPASCRCTSSTVSPALKPSSWWSWPMTAMWLSAAHCTTLCS